MTATISRLIFLLFSYSIFFDWDDTIDYLPQKKVWTLFINVRDYISFYIGVKYFAYVIWLSLLVELINILKWQRGSLQQM